MKTIFAILVLAAFQAHALSIWTQLTPRQLQEETRLAFQVKAEDTPTGKRFRVSVAPKHAELSPFLEANLVIFDGESEVASCPVANTGKGKLAQYEFTVAPKYLAKSKFIFANMAHDAQGRPMPAGDFYWFCLADFAGGLSGGSIPKGLSSGTPNG